MKCPIRNTILCLIAGIVILSPALSCGAQKILRLDLPSWITNADVAYWIGSTQLPSIKESLNAEGISNGAFQDAVSKRIESFVPAKIRAIVADATRQRLCIASSNILFGWQAYPTFYGSSDVYAPEFDIVTEMPRYEAATAKEKLSLFGESLARFASRFPDTKFCVVLPDMSRWSAVNPAHSLINDATSSQELFSILEDALRDTKNAYAVCDILKTSNEYTDLYYKTDHHWNGWGALRTYNLAASATGDIQISCEPYLSGYFGDLHFEGSYTRDGRILLNAPIHEPDLNVRDILPTPDIGSCVNLDEGVRRLMQDPRNSLINMVRN